MQRRKTEELKPHPLNRRLYGDKADQDLLDSIRQNGILSPLVITEDNVIVSGHRRHDAARRLELPEVPVVVSNLKDDTDIERALIHANEQRQRTVEQKIREYKHLKTIEQRLAHQRQAAAGKRGAEGGRGKKKDRTLGDVLPKGNEHRAAAIAARPFELSYKTLDKGVEVVNRIDELVRQGKKSDAEQIRTALGRSVGTAYRVVTKGVGASGGKSKERKRLSPEKDAPLFAWGDYEPTAVLTLLVKHLRGARVSLDGDKKTGRRSRDAAALKAVEAALELLVEELGRRKK